MRTNRLGKIGLQYISRCGMISLTDRRKTIKLDRILKALEGVRLMDGYTAEAITPGRGGMGGECTVYARPSGLEWRFTELNEDDDPMPSQIELPEGCRKLTDCLEVEFTEEGIWSAFLLSELWRNLPLWWHANYAKETYVLDMDSLLSDCKIKSKEASALEGLTQDQLDPEVKRYEFRSQLDKWLIVRLSKEDTLLPSVKLMDGTHAEIDYSYWSDWRGLVNHKVMATLEDRKISFETKDCDILAHYDCGIMF